MSAKRVSIRTKPRRSAHADAWVEERVLPEEREPMKRLTIDIPESLHRTIKVQCALRGRKIADEVRELLLQKYGNNEIIKS